MKRFALLSLLFIIPFIYSCASDEKPGTESSPDYSDPEVLQELFDSGKAYDLVDVRTPEEYAGGYIPTAENIPLDTIGKNPPTEDKDALIVVYCRSGNRSGQAEKILQDMGYTNVHNFGGIGNWPGEIIKN